MNDANKMVLASEVVPFVPDYEGIARANAIEIVLPSKKVRKVSK